MKQQSVEARLAALDAEVARRKEIQEMPEDPLSQSMREYYQELASLDELGKAALLEDGNTERKNPQPHLIPWLHRQLQVK